MGTRLLSESLIKSRYPHLRYVRIHTGGSHKATIYAWNEQLQLTEEEIYELKKFASDHLLPYVCFQVKAYPMIRQEQVPPVYELPEPITQAAMSRGLTLYGIVNIINDMFVNGEMTIHKYDSFRGVIHLKVQTATALTDIEKELIRQYLYEMVPLGSCFEVAYC